MTHERPLPSSTLPPPIIPVDPACIAMPMSGTQHYVYVFEDELFDTVALVRRAVLDMSQLTEE